MFYSQFILAKKGPLGTIWIAAHLERKLRKNQVADTDIGVSVDSILFPDVPIALRLSSHLLLGVVRIYSRKVNYLFDDCSEALLKIKQAFRSTAVDLPPEQSKAPYHSITLPETFDLDDFELPDNEIFQGNYVDHHVSSREQITLQDTIDGVAYSTTRFGLDERFGDGDTSGLDLDEELFLDKDGASVRAGVSTDRQVSVRPITALKQGDQHEGMIANSEPMIEGVDEAILIVDDAQAPCTPGLVEESNLSNAQETSACDDHFETEDHHITVSVVKEKLKNSSGGADIHYENRHIDGWSLSSDKNSHLAHKLSENGYHPGDLNIEQLKPQEIYSATELTVEHFSPNNHASASGPTSLLDKHVIQLSPVSKLRDKIAEVSDFPFQSEHIGEGVIDNNKVNICSVHESLRDYGRPDGSNVKKNADDTFGSASICQLGVGGFSEKNQTSPVIEVSDNLDSAGMLENSCFPSNAIDLAMDDQGRPCQEKAEGQTCQEGIESRILTSDINGKIPAPQVQVLRPYNAYLDQLGSSNPEGDQSVDANLTNKNATLGSVEVFEREETQHTSETFAVSQDELSHLIDGTEEITTEDNVREGASDGIHSAIGKSNNQLNNDILGGSAVEHVNSSTGPYLSAPEKLLSVTEGHDNLPRNLLMESTPRDVVRNDDGASGSNIISGKKRSYTESTLTEQSLNSVEYSRIVRSKRTIESIPDDDDLLSSILVGRRSSVLNVKPTPPSEITSTKRTHSASRTSAFKRKILMDDTMVLHGDTIRQQLMNTEDIRRVRKKAPCTRPEISMIQKQFLEDEVFIEPLYTGVSIELASLHNQTRDLSGIRIAVDDVDYAALGTATDINNQNDDNKRNLSTENVVNSSLQNIAKEIERQGTNNLLTVKENCEKENVDAPVDMSNLDQDNSVTLDVNITQLQMKNSTYVETNSLLLESSQDVPKTEATLRSSSVADGVHTDFPVEDESLLLTGQVSGDQCVTSADVAQVAPGDDNSACVVQADGNINTCGLDASLHADALDISHDQKTDEVPLGMDATGGVVIEDHDILVKDSDHTAVVEAEPRTGDEGLLDTAEGDGMAETVTYANGKKSEYDSHNIVDKDMEQPIMDSFPGEVDTHVEDVLLDDGEHLSLEVVNLLNTRDVELSAICDHDDVNCSTARNDTEFLNVDDDEVAEPTDDYMPNEETCLTDNSGWSSRTRAVANYLQTLFIKQGGNARPILSMDNLLVGKTRKEASRMFFEALVLKTRDYIRVEQENPFGEIIIKQCTKLMKTDF